jgi:ribosome-associated toxin RatA of RatAB toxin-antitoxin module
VQWWSISFAAAALALLMAAHAAPGLAAEDVLVEAQRAGEGVEVRARALIAAPQPLVWEVLTNYERLPSFIPGIAKSVVRSRQGARVTVDQSGEATFLLFSFPIDIRLEVTEGAPDWVASRAVSGNLRRMNGRYDIQPDARGGVLLRYSGVIEPDFELPPLIGAAALRSMVEQQFTAMVAEIERRAAIAAGTRETSK